VLALAPAIAWAATGMVVAAAIAPTGVVAAGRVLAPEPEPARVGRDGGVSVAVGPRDLGARLLDHGQRFLPRVPVAVVGTDADERDGGADDVVEPRVLVGRAVVRHLDDVGPRHLVARRREQAPLRRRGEVAEVEQGEAPDRAARQGAPEGDDARVVARRRARVRRPEDGPAEVAEDTAHARRHLDQLGSPVDEHVDDGLVGVAAHRPDQRPADAPRDDVDGAHVVGVEVREHEQVDAVDAEAAEAAAQRLLVVAHVDERDLARAADQHRVALPDVALGHRPVARHRGPLARPDAGDRPDEDDERAGQHHAEHPSCPSPRAREHDRGEDHGQAGQHHHAGRAARPRDPGQRPRGDRTRHGADPGGRHPRRPGRDLGDAGSPGGGQADEQTPDGREGRGRLGQHVGDDAVHGEPRVEEEQHRLARELGGDGDRQQHGERPGQDPGEDVGERRREHDEPRGREHGQGERDVAGQPRVDDEQTGHRQRHHGQARHRARRREVHEHDEGHHRGSHDARLGRDQHEEREQDARREPDAEEPRHAERPAGEHHESDEHRAVRPGDGGEVRQRRRRHRVVEVVADRGRVAHREPGQQAAAVTREPGGHGPEVGAHGVGQPRRTRGRIPRDELAPDRGHEGDVVAGLDGEHRDPRRQGLTDLDGRPVRRPRPEEQHRRATPPGHVPAHDDLAHRDLDGRAALDHAPPGVAVHLGGAADEPDEGLGVPDLLAHGGLREHEPGDQAGEGDEGGDGHDSGCPDRW
jgi:hypothetical protein